MHEKITSCQCCGTCCRKGGPALHRQDRELIVTEHISFQQLVTIRQGEFAHNPITGKNEPVKQEMIKLAGKDKEWTCCFLGIDNRCTLYQHRPLECHLLKCWDTAEVCAVMGRDTLKREDLIRPDDPILKLVQQHNRECSCHDLATLIIRSANKKEDATKLIKLTKLVNSDLKIRQQAIAEFNLPVGVEMFVFGRPIFTSMPALGLAVHEAPDGKIEVNRKNNPAT